MQQYLFVIYHCRNANTSNEWDAYFKILGKGRHLIGGSALGKGIGIKNGRAGQPRAKTAGGYMAIRAKNLAVAKNLAKLCPVHQKGGVIDVFPMEKDK